MNRTYASVGELIADLRVYNPGVRFGTLKNSLDFDKTYQRSPREDHILLSSLPPDQLKWPTGASIKSNTTGNRIIEISRGTSPDVIQYVQVENIATYEAHQQKQSASHGTRTKSTSTAPKKPSETSTIK